MSDKLLHKLAKKGSAKHLGNFLRNIQDKLLHKLAKKAAPNFLYVLRCFFWQNYAIICLMYCIGNFYM